MKGILLALFALQFAWGFQGTSAQTPSLARTQLAVAKSDLTYVATPCYEDLSQWAYSNFGENMCSAGLVIGDFNQNGVPEIVLSGSEQFWQVIEYDGQDYQQLRVGPVYGSLLVQLLQMNTPGGPVLVSVLANGEVVWTDLVTYRLAGHAQLSGVNQIRRAVLTDLEGDGNPEFVLSDQQHLYVYGAVAPFALLKTYPNKGRGLFAVGNFDKDPALELAVQDAMSHGCVIDGVTGAVQWDAPMGFGSKLAGGDIDGDGVDEVVGLQGNRLRAFDADLQIQKWSKTMDRDMEALTLRDLDDDGVAEVLLGEQTGSGVICLEGSSGDQRWRFESPEDSISVIALADVDGDLQNDILWNSGALSSAADRLYVADLDERLVKWTSPAIDGSFVALAAGDLNGDLHPELVATNDAGQLLIFDGLTKALLQQIQLVDTGAGLALAIGDVDDDGKPEIVAACEDFHDGIVMVFDGETYDLKWASDPSENHAFKSLLLGDVDSDPQLEIIVGEDGLISTGDGARVRIFDILLGTQQWESASLTDSFGKINDLLLVDLAGTGSPALIATTSVSTWLWTLPTMAATSLAPQGYALAAANIDSDAAHELLVGSDQGTALVFDGVSLTQQGTISFFGPNDPVVGLLLADIHDDGQLVWVAQSLYDLVVFDPDSGEAIWSPDDCLYHAYTQHPVLINLDEDPALEVFVGLGVSLRIYDFDSCSLFQFQQALPNWPTTSVLGLMADLCQ